MTDSNIGARRARNIRDHLFIIYGVMNSVLRGGAECIDMQLYDIEKCFDALWLDECLNDLYDTLPKQNLNDKISLLHKSNQKNLVAVQTSVGLTDRIDMPCIVQQGGIWGSLLCSNSIDSIGRYCKTNSECIYLYKNAVEILPLAYVDDLNGLAVCGLDSVKLNNLKSLF